ncbi:SurA N-terminal domain-containing protein [Rickettsiales bacterium]|nr:SurA N-terminal domain-containing protein [Rickettsiales bacterium]
MHILKALIITLLLPIFAHPKHAKSLEIIAVVGESVITDYDLNQRTRIVMMLNQINVTDIQEEEKIKKEVIPILIDEQIKKSYIEQIKLQITQTDIDKLIDSYLPKLKLTNRDEINDLLKKYEIEDQMFQETLSTEISWAKFVYGGLSQNVQISEEEMKHRMIIMGFNGSDPRQYATAKQAIIEEKLSMHVKKLITQMKKLHVVETVNKDHKQ